MTYIEKRELLSRFKMSIAEGNISKLISILNDEEILFLMENVKKIGYDSKMITNYIPVKKEKVEVVKEIPNAFEVYQKERALRFN